MSASCWRKHKRALSVELVSFYLQIGLPNDACAFLAFFHQNQLARAKVEHAGADFGSTIFEWSKSPKVKTSSMNPLGAGKLAYAAAS